MDKKIIITSVHITQKEELAREIESCACTVDPTPVYLIGNELIL